jgi:hypothetical protein
MEISKILYSLLNKDLIDIEKLRKKLIMKENVPIIYHKV